MRKVVLSVGISLDGYIARTDGGVDFLFMPKGFSMQSFFATVDTEVMGRKTLDAALRMSGGSLPGSSMARYVFSRSRPPGDQVSYTYIQQSPASFVSQLRKRLGKDLWLMGGGELAREFLKADLVDEIHLGVVPVLLGAGIPLFPGGFPQREFKLFDNKTFPKGMIFLKYRRARAKAGKKAA
jgi:dihydrofolate reductase